MHQSCAATREAQSVGKVAKECVMTPSWRYRTQTSMKRELCFQLYGTKRISQAISVRYVPICTSCMIFGTNCMMEMEDVEETK